MVKRVLGLLLVLAISALTAFAQDAEPVTLRESAPDASTVTFTEVATGLFKPLSLTNAGDGSGRLFVLEQTGKILIIKDGALLDTPFIDLSGVVSQDVLRGYSERGLLGLAFHPDYEENGQFYVNYTAQQGGQTQIARYTVSADNPDVADLNSGEIIFRIDQPFPNHNGGHIAFGPDGYLYVGLGDGGAAGDPLQAGQNLEMLLGKMLRLDVDNGSPYAIPADNPFVNDSEAMGEIWAYGLRNPWRFSFDRATGDLYIADVGQNLWEEINFQPADSPGGENYGWNIYEASYPYAMGTPPEGMIYPFAEYKHEAGNCSVSGGYVYRGEAIPNLQGVYLFGDFCTGQMWASFRDVEGNWQTNPFTLLGFQLSAFGEGEDGELYAIDYGGGRVLRLETAN